MTEIKNKKKNKPYKILTGDVKSDVKLLIGCILFCLFFIGLHDSQSSGCGPTEAPESIVYSLQQSLRSASAIYVAQQKVAPVSFSNFVVPEGIAKDHYTLTLDNINASEKIFNGTKLNITTQTPGFITQFKATYYLNGSDVTASYEEINTEEYAKYEFNKNMHFLIILTFLSSICFIIVKICIGNIIGRILLFIAVLLLLADAATPRFAKPAIYLYPKKPTEVNITLDKRIKITLDVPKYAANKGWYVMAYPNSKIVDLQSKYTDCNTLDSNQFGLEYAKEACLNNNYPYIYWEGDSFKKQLPVQTKGWLVKTTNIKAFLTTKLDEVGLNDSEKAEFIRYWVHKIKESKKETVFISFMQTEVIEQYLPMTVNPKPDSINRFYIIVDLNVNAHKNPQAQKLIRFKRDGFILVDWGGCVIE